MAHHFIKHLAHLFICCLLLLERHRGLVVRALAYGAEGPQIEITFDWVSGKLSLFTQQLMVTRLSSELWKV